MALNHKTRRHSDGPGGAGGSSFASTPEYIYRQAIQVTLDQIPDTIEGKIIVCTSCREGGAEIYPSC